MKNKEKQLKSKQKKQLKALEVLKPEENKEETKSVEGLFAKYMRTNEIKNKINDIKKWQSKIKWKDLKYEAKNYIYDLQRYDTAITPFVDNICSGKININEVEIDETNLLKTWEEFSEKSRPRTKRGKGKKEILLKL